MAVLSLPREQWLDELGARITPMSGIEIAARFRTFDGLSSHHKTTWEALCASSMVPRNGTMVGLNAAKSETFPLRMAAQKIRMIGTNLSRELFFEIQCSEFDVDSDYLLRPQGLRRPMTSIAIDHDQ